MKKLNTLFFFTFLFITTTYAQVITDGLVSYYPFDSLSTNDIAMNLSHGAVVGSIIAVSNKKGEDQKAIMFEEQSKIILLGLINNLLETDATASISFWYKNYSLAEDDYEVILSKTESDPLIEPDSLSLGIYSENKMFFSQAEQMSAPAASDEWNHVLVTYNNGQRAIYINCVLEGTSDGDFFGDNAAALTLGNNTYTGALDELLFYDRVLSQEEICQVYMSNCIVSSTETVIPSAIKVFPNPSNDFIQIELEHNNYTLELFDINGKILNRKENLSSNLERISLKNYTSGSYVLVVKDELGRTLWRKIVFKQ